MCDKGNINHISCYCVRALKNNYKVFFFALLFLFVDRALIAKLCFFLINLHTMNFSDQSVLIGNLEFGMNSLGFGFFFVLLYGMALSVIRAMAMFVV